jgi:hypothetical protein
MLYRLCFFRYNKTLEKLIDEYKTGSVRAVKQFYKLMQEFELWRPGKLDPNKEIQVRS